MILSCSPAVGLAVSALEVHLNVKLTDKDLVARRFLTPDVCSHIWPLRHNVFASEVLSGLGVEWGKVGGEWEVELVAGGGCVRCGGGRRHLCGCSFLSWTATRTLFSDCMVELRLSQCVVLQLRESVEL